MQILHYGEVRSKCELLVNGYEALLASRLNGGKGAIEAIVLVCYLVFHANARDQVLGVTRDRPVADQGGIVILGVHTQSGKHAGEVYLIAVLLVKFDIHIEHVIVDLRIRQGSIVDLDLIEVSVDVVTALPATSAQIVDLSRSHAYLGRALDTLNKHAVHIQRQ